MKFKSTSILLKQTIKNNVGTVPKSNRKIGERGKNDTSITQIYDSSLSWLDIGNSMKSDGVKHPQTSPINEMMWSCSCFPHGNKCQTSYRYLPVIFVYTFNNTKRIINLIKHWKLKRRVR